MTALNATIWDDVVGDFADLPDALVLARVAVRLSVAAALGGAIGWQRQHRGKSAGMRTHMLVTLGTACFVLFPAQLGWGSADLSRVVQGIVTGIGFLGAGTILKRNDKGVIQGLTTAADIWLTAAIGVAAGLGRLASATLATVLALGILTLAVYLEPRQAELERREGEEGFSDAAQKHPEPDASAKRR